MLAALALALASFALLALSMDRHQRDALGRRLDGTPSRWLRGAGWVLLAASAVPPVAGQGWGMGLVQWLGALTPAAGVVLGGLAVASAADRAAPGKEGPAARD